MTPCRPHQPGELPAELNLDNRLERPRLRFESARMLK